VSSAASLAVVRTGTKRRVIKGDRMEFLQVSWTSWEIRGRSSEKQRFGNGQHFVMTYLASEIEKESIASFVTFDGILMIFLME